MAETELYLRVKLGLPSSDEAKILERHLGEKRAWSYTLEMWDWFATKHPGGEHTGRDASYLIARGAGWEGDPDKFCAAMVLAGFLAPVPEGFRARGWEKWAGFYFTVKAKATAKKQGQRAAALAKSLACPPACPGDVPGTQQGQAPENKAPDGACPGDPSPISPLGSGSLASEGVQGEAKTPHPDIDPEDAASWPVLAACLAALWERGRDARWPKDRDTTSRLDRLAASMPLPEAIERLDASLEAMPDKPWLGWHEDALKPKPKRKPRDSSDRWQDRLTPDEFHQAHAELRALHPDLAAAPLGCTGDPAIHPVEQIAELNERWRKVAEARS